MDIKEIEEKVKSVVEKAKSDPQFHKELKENPVKAVEGLLGVDLPDEQIKAVVEAAKSKLHLEDGMEGAKNLMGEAEDKIKGLFHKE